ncbi:MAG TPA: tetratricopeptide repeat protein, partial [Elusimicrobiota bacterium]|nr:tetratricopeptide repeat protein [Elusimicrobiota bacterium]
SAPYVELAGVYRKMGYLRRAVSDYQKGAAIEPTGTAYLGMAESYVDEGDMTAATAALEEARPLLPKADYNVSLGEILHRTGDMAKAAAAWEAAIQADSSRDDIRLKLAVVYNAMGRRTQADHLLRDMESRYPESPLVHFLRAWVLYDEGQRAAALAHARKVEQLEPTDLVEHYNAMLMSRLKQ